MSTQSKNVMTSATIFDIYYLQKQICEQLSSRDIRRCTLVSRNFYQNFSPYIYQTIHITRRSTFNRFCRPESIQALQRNISRVLQVTCYFAEIWKILFTHRSFNLTTIKSPSFKKRPQNQLANKAYIPYIITLIQSCPNLQILEVGHFLYDDSIVESFCQAVRGHKVLRELEIDHFNYVFCRMVRLILWSSYKLEKLSINLTVSDYSKRHGSPEILKTLDALTGQENPVFKIKQLRFRGSIYNHEIFTFVRFLERCPNLEWLTLPSMYVSRIRDVASCNLSNLRHLDISSMDISGISILQLIDSCQNLSSFVGGNTIMLENSILESLKNGHRQSLQELDMSRSFRFSGNIHDTLSSFPNLKVLKLMTPYSKIDNKEDIAMAHELGNPTLDVNELPSDRRPWVCQGLKELTLWYQSDSAERVGGSNYSNNNNNDDDAGDDDDVDNNEGSRREERDENDYRGAFPRILYERIGQLTELKVLWLGRKDSGRDPIEDANIISAGDSYSTEGIKLNSEGGLRGLSRLSNLENLQLRRMKEFVPKEVINEARTQWPLIKRILVT